MTNSIGDGAVLMVVGMGIVFVFLALLIFLVRGMSGFIMNLDSAAAAGEAASAAANVPAAPVPAPAPVASSGGETVTSPMAGNIFRIDVHVGDAVGEGQVVAILEAMKMETEVRARVGGMVSAIPVKEGDSVSVGDDLVQLS